NNQITHAEPVSATNVGIAGFGAPTVYTSLARSGIFRFVRGSINVGGSTVTRNSPLLVDTNGNLKPGVPVCNGSTIVGNCVDSYNMFANDPQGIGGDPAVLALMNSFPAANAFSLGEDSIKPDSTGTRLLNSKGPTTMCEWITRLVPMTASLSGGCKITSIPSKVTSSTHGPRCTPDFHHWVK